MLLLAFQQDQAWPLSVAEGSICCALLVLQLSVRFLGNSTILVVSKYYVQQGYRPPFPKPSVDHGSSESLSLEMVKTTLHPYTPDPSNARAKAIRSGFPTPSRISFHQHLLHLAPSPLIAQQHSSPFLVQPIARTTIDWVDIDRLQSVHNRNGDSQQYYFEQYR